MSFSQHLFFQFVSALILKLSVNQVKFKETVNFGGVFPLISIVISSLFFTEDCILVFTSFFCKQGTMFLVIIMFFFTFQSASIHNNSYKVTTTSFKESGDDPPYIYFLLLQAIQIAGVCTDICLM